MPELDETTLRKVLVLDAQNNNQEGAERIYRCVAPLRDLLPSDAQKCLAAVFEWAIQGIKHQDDLGHTDEMEALRSAMSYARDVLVETARRTSESDK
jgi:hypothetical protein